MHNREELDLSNIHSKVELDLSSVLGIVEFKSEQSES